MGVTKKVSEKHKTHSKANRRPSAYKRHFAPPRTRVDMFPLWTQELVDGSDVSWRISPCYGVKGFAGPSFVLLNGFKELEYHEPVSDYWGGSGVTAYLHPWSYRSRNSDADATAIGCMHDLGLTAKGWITGHLLNAELGGPGNEPKNLTPLDSKANSAHKNTTETPIKEFLDASRTITESEDRNDFYGVKYTVKVIKNGAGVPSGIRCWAGLWQCTFLTTKTTRTSLAISAQVSNQQEIDGTPARDYLGDLLSADGILISNAISDPSKAF